MRLTLFFTEKEFKTLIKGRMSPDVETTVNSLIKALKKRDEPKVLRLDNTLINTYRIDLLFYQLAWRKGLVPDGLRDPTKIQWDYYTETDSSENNEQIHVIFTLWLAY